jgi:hypothetical protein
LTLIKDKHIHQHQHEHKHNEQQQQHIPEDLKIALQTAQALTDDINRKTQIIMINT